MPRGMGQARRASATHALTRRDPAARGGARVLPRLAPVLLASVLLLLACLGGSAHAMRAAAGTVGFAEKAVAPKITKQPVGVEVEEGQNATFEATASGVPAPTVQWEVSTDGGATYKNVEGATADQLTVANVKTSQTGYRYRAVFVNEAGKATTAAAVLTVQNKPVVTKQPVSVTVEEGQSAVFEAAATGFPTPTVLWEVSTDGGATWANVAGGTKTTLTVANTKTTFNGREYRAKFKNAAGNGRRSEAATLTVHNLPAVTKQPVSVTVDVGQGVSFEATASGFPAPTLQWEVSTNGGSTWSPIEGATSSPLTIASATLAESANQYRAVFTNAAGTATSTAATLTVHEPPAVSSQPASVTVEEPQGASFEAAASGVPAPTVQWELSTNGGSTWSAVSGATSDKLTIASAKTSENGHEYRATFTNVAGKATSNAATLTVQKAPAITKQPASVTVNQGANAVFEAAASGFPAPTVQWELSSDGGSTWTPLEGATSGQLTITATTISESGNEYRAVFTNAAGSATTAAATLTVHAPPVLTEQPVSTIVEVGETATFEAAATGAPTPTVQWELSTNGGSTWSAVPEATSDQLSIANAKSTESGDEFRATFTNVAGKATSTAAKLTVATTKYNAVAWGSNLKRQLGNGTFEALSDVPLPVSGLKFVTAVAAGGSHSLALLADASVVAWGNNEFGQLGDGTETNRGVPVAVGGLKEVTAIAAGGSHSLALLKNGTVMAWGYNFHGQLGDGKLGTEEAGETEPVPVKGLTKVKAIAAGGEHSLALLENGTVMAWGNDENGQLGNGTLKPSSDVPVAVKGLTGVTAISAGGEFSLALTSKGTVQAWGADEAGQLGNAGVEEGTSDVPVPVEELSGVTAIAAGAEHALALLGGGTVMAWGSDTSGELGNGTIKPSEGKPVAVSGLSGVSAISAGGHDSVALLGGGSLMAWGINHSGTLGDGTTGSPSDVPVVVAGISKVANVSAGGAHMLAFGEPTAVVTGLSPSLGPATGGNKVLVSGDSFTGATAVKFGATPAVEFTVTSPTTLEAVAPAGTGTVDITVTTPAGVSPTGPADRYTYVKPPTVTKLSAKSGPTAGENSVTITGTEFTGVTNVSFGANSATKFTVNSPTSITATVPAGAVGLVDVTVANVGGTSATSTKDHYTYTPTVESVAPNTGSTAGHTSVTVTGTGFVLGSTGTTFKFGTGKATSVSCSSSTTCTMLSPAGAAGTVNVVATVNKVKSPVNPGDQFTYA